MNEFEKSSEKEMTSEEIRQFNLTKQAVSEQINHCRTAVVKMPTMGRIVHYYPGAYDHQLNRIAQSFPAVVQDDSMTPVITIFTGRDYMPVVVRRNILHKSVHVSEPLTHGYWDWPEIK